MTKTWLWIFLLMFIANVQAQQRVEQVSVEDIKLSDELKKDAEYIQVDCGLRPSAVNREKDSTFRLKAVEVFAQDGEKTKLKKTCGTVEGDPIFSCLLLEKGKATMFIDSTQDKFGHRRITSYLCMELDLGHYFNDLKAGKMVFRKVENANITNDSLVLRCGSNNNEVYF